MEKQNLAERVNLTFEVFRKSVNNHDLLPGFLRRYQLMKTSGNIKEAFQYVEDVFREGHYELLSIEDKPNGIFIVYQRHLPWDSDEGLRRSRILKPEPEPVDLEYLRISPKLSLE